MKSTEKVTGKLNALLGNYQIHYQNLRGLHWNIQGKHFFELHAKFEELYTNTAEKIDEVAERLLTVGSVPLHTYADYLEVSEIRPQKNVHNGESAVQVIVDDLEHIVKSQKEIRQIAEEDGDGATADMLAAFVEEQEKTLWMYSAWLK